MPAKETRTVAARIPNGTADQIDLIAKVSGVTPSKVVARLIEDGLLAARDARKSGRHADESDALLVEEEETQDE